MYTVFLVFFSCFNMTANESNISFEKEKPDIAIINEDTETGITKGLIDYLVDNCNEKKYDEEADLSDALFYRDVNYVVRIPKGFRNDFLSGMNPQIHVQSTGDYQASLAEMLLGRYLDVAEVYKNDFDEEELLSVIEDTLTDRVDVHMTSKLDTTSLDKAAAYYNFTNYCLLAGAIFIITLILATFKDERIAKRTIVSSVNYASFNRKLILCNGLFTLLLWALYVLISFFTVGEVMFSVHGVLYVVNSFVFSLCCLSVAFLIGSLVRNKEAINGIVNVVALGSSFLCGAFVPMQWLPDSVLMIAHVLPSYWFIKSNELIKGLEIVDWSSVAPLLFNMSVLLGFTLVFVAITLLVSNKKRRFG